MKIKQFQKERKEIINKQTSKNYMKMQKFAIFVNKNLKINILKIKNIVKLKILVIIQWNTEVLYIVYEI